MKATYEGVKVWTKKIRWRTGFLVNQSTNPKKNSTKKTKLYYYGLVYLICTAFKAHAFGLFLFIVIHFEKRTLIFSCHPNDWFLTFYQLLQFRAHIIRKKRNSSPSSSENIIVIKVGQKRCLQHVINICKPSALLAQFWLFWIQFSLMKFTLKNMFQIQKKNSCFKAKHLALKHI